MTRMPIVAGTFYDASPSACRAAVKRLFEQARLPEGAPKACIGGLVPHAGWVCSGAVAATTLKAIAQDWTGGTLVLLGAVHSRTGPEAILYPAGTWKTPLGSVAVDEEVAELLLAASPEIVADPAAHDSEHSLEVQLPLIQELWPQAKIVPIMMPPSPAALEVGQAIGRALASLGRRVPVLGSTDLTHYGPRYGIVPAGAGKAGLAWAQRNDRKLLQLVESMAAEDVLEDTYRTHSACGGGAIAATMAACAQLGAKTATVLQLTNSVETLRPLGVTDLDNVVGYASVVFS
jgi:MEMO1 family protein